jgi:hypothetical protein
MGPETVTGKHRDHGNSPGIPCAITALGDYNPDTSGHLIITELRLIIRFPPGATILISSASFEHFNAPIQPGETRTSFTQYVSGGILRYVEWGFRGWKAIPREEQQQIRAGDAARFRNVLARFSTVDSLTQDLEDLRNEN